MCTRLGALVALQLWALTVVTCLSPDSWAHSAGAPAGRTGAPGEATCVQCHTSYPLGAGSASFQVLTPSAWQPGEPLPVTVAFQNSRTLIHGFQITARAADGAVAGFFQSLGPSTQGLGAGTWMTHTASGNTFGYWSFLWNPPITHTPAVTFYAAGNEANGDGTNDGDFIYTTSRTIPILTLTRIGAPQIGSVVSLVTTIPPDAGLPYVIGASLERFGLTLPDGRRVPLSPDPLLGATLAGLVPVFRNFFGILDSSGLATSPVLIPNDPNLIGLTLHFAALTVDPGAPSGIRTISNGQAVTIEA